MTAYKNPADHRRFDRFCKTTLRQFRAQGINREKPPLKFPPRIFTGPDGIVPGKQTGTPR